MLEYVKPANPLNVNIPIHIEHQLDNVPLRHPFVPRICEEQGHLLIWWVTKEQDPNLYDCAMLGKSEPQWIISEHIDRLEKGVALIYPYDDEIIVGSVKYSGCIKFRDSKEVKEFIRDMWRDIIKLFGDKRIVCPSGIWLEYIHLLINQERIPHLAYHRAIMSSFKFKRSGEFWIREPR